MPYITCRQKKTRHKVHVSVCESCRGIGCPDYRNYLQLSLFPGMAPDQAVRPKFQAENIKSEDRPDSNPPEQMSWLKKTETTSPGP